MAVIVIGEVNAGISCLLGHTCIVEKTLGGNYSTVVDAHELSLEDG